MKHVKVKGIEVNQNNILDWVPDGFLFNVPVNSSYTYDDNDPFHPFVEKGDTLEKQFSLFLFKVFTSKRPLDGPVYVFQKRCTSKNSSR